MDLNNFLLFALASLILNVTPGSDMLYVATRSTGQGIKAGVVSAFGITAGCAVHVLAAVLGLSAVLSTSAVAFSLIKYAGAGYLIYLGVNAFIKKESAFVVDVSSVKMSMGKIFSQGVITNVLNPKVALFFLAFLPQFVQASDRNASYYFLLLGIWFSFSGTVVNLLVALLFGKMGNWLTRKPWFLKWQQKITGLMLLLLGLKLALTKK